MPRKIKGVKIIDHGWDAISKTWVLSQKGIFAKIGVQGDKAESVKRLVEGRKAGAPKTLIEVAAYHEFGGGGDKRRPPERSYLRSTFDENQNDYRGKMDEIGGQSVEDLAKGGYKPGYFKGRLRMLGENYRTDILKKINAMIPPPLAPSTVARKKGEATPLIDTGQLRDSIRVDMADQLLGGE